MTKDPPILLTDHGSYAIVTLHRPDQLNCLTRELINELAAKLETLREEPRYLSLIITGAGGLFSAGADLNEVSALDPASAFEFSRRGQTLFGSLRTAVPLTIAAIDGYCLGGGLDLALSCDLRYATPRSSIQHPGSRRGLITGWGGTQRLVKTIGLDAARRMLVSGDRLDAAEAHRLGLFTRIVEDAVAASRQLAEQVAGRFTRDRLLAIKRELPES
ncbi:MAG TPA: enoyl-CoA hydratase/isomerase family protein [Blastocatellia bacterium]|nr:enoyl-CoA hydratase/isomerase family protein [Blastocatellia bacterium]